MGTILAATGLLTAGAAGGALAASGSGGAAYVATPKIKAVKCVKSCMSRGRVQGGGKIKLRGANLGEITRVIYRGARGRRDDVAVRVRPASDRSVAVRVPMRAQSGPLDAWAGDQAHARTRRAVRIMPPAAPEPNRELTPVPSAAGTRSSRLETATSRSMFAIDQRGGVRFKFRFTGGDVPPSVRVSLVRLDSDKVVRTWTREPEDGVVEQVNWNGLVRGKVPRYGRYAFRLAATTAGGVSAANAPSGDVSRDAFDLQPAVFPVKGRHNYGGSNADFGSGRSGHSHQGHDVFAKCGTPLRAARGGVVKAKEYHSAAGYYLVIDAARTGVDYAYMHLTAPSAYSEGDRVRTGDQLGTVGDSGNASGCHLHFELWSAPGWYTGGQPFDPLASLRRWDRYS